MGKRPWKESKRTISLPDEVWDVLDAAGSHLYTSGVDHLRKLAIDFARRETDPQPVETTSTLNATGPRGSRSGFKGVYAYGRRWEAVVYTNNRRRRLSVHETAEDAARAYDAHLVAQANDPNAAVNFPPGGPAPVNPGTTFVEQFASAGKLSDLDWQRWQQVNNPAAPTAGPLTVRPDGAPMIDASTPLVDRPGKQLYRRDSATVIPAPVADPDRPDPVPAEPDEDAEHVH